MERKKTRKCGKGEARKGSENKVGTRTLSIRALKAKLNTQVVSKGARNARNM